MRKIKFRAWDSYFNGYIENYVVYSSGINDVFKNGSLVNEENVLEFEQYAGLKDKNGVEIYEGDIIKDKYGEIFKIEYNNEKSSFGSIMYNHKEFYFLHEIEEIKVIGNIHQNKELLE